MKKQLTLLFALCNLFTYAQNSSYQTFGRISQADADIKYFEKDTTANALVLYENAETRFLVENRIFMSTAYYFKIKLFKKEGFEHATFKIPFYNNERRTEKVEDIQGFTHNGLIKTALKKENIFTERVNDNWREISFTMPNLKEGSIIEIKYTVKSPFMFNLTDWEFQTDIPKLYSEYKGLIPGIYAYNRKKIGNLPLVKNQTSLKKNCFEVPGYGSADCEVFVYAMKNIPPFVEEAYMTNKKNFMGALKFELMESQWFDGRKEKYSKEWKDVDKEFENDNDLGRQLKKSDFFSDKLPPEVAATTDELEKAKIIHRYITDHFAYNDKFGLWKDVKVKKSYEEKTASATAINLSLINAFQAAGLKVQMMLLSTRANGLATKEYPVISDFNYAVAKLDIGEKYYLLDATDKNAPFGLLPYRCLNSYGRVMDFENGSYWLDIEPESKSKQQTTVQLSMEEDGQINGHVRNVNYKYDALERRNEIMNLSEESIIEQFEARFSNVYVESYEVKNLHNLEKPLSETFEISLDDEDDLNLILFNPFFGNSFKSNPFKQDKRSYPVDFGHPRKYYLNFTMDLPDGYVFKSVPGSKKFVMSEEKGSYTLMTRKRYDFNVQLKSSLILPKSKYFSFEYPELKQLFQDVVVMQNKDIVIEKELSK